MLISISCSQFLHFFLLSYKQKNMNSTCKQYRLVVLLIPVMLLLFPTSGFSDHERKKVTPYGDFCPECTKYGTCKTPMSHDEARKAMIDYYHKKGLSVEVEHKRGRFIRAKIKEKAKVVDIIIFDRQTGRVRSIY